MKREITQSIINVFKTLKTTLPEKDFIDNVKLQLPQYKITPLFISEFRDYLNKFDIYGMDLSADCIKELGTDFSTSRWMENVSTKDIEILMDSEFCDVHGIITSDVLKTAKSIPDNVFKKYYASASDEVKRNMLVHCSESVVTDDMIRDAMPYLGMEFFNISYVRNHTLKDSNNIKDLLTGRTFEVTVPFLLSLMTSCYCPAEMAEYLGTMPLIADMQESASVTSSQNAPIAIVTNLTAQNAGTGKYDPKYTEMLWSVIEKYPNTVLDKFIPIIASHANYLLQNRSLLRNYLVACDNISEDCLLDIYEIFVVQDLRKELVNYALNYGYKNLLIAIKLI